MRMMWITFPLSPGTHTLQNYGNLFRKRWSVPVLLLLTFLLPISDPVNFYRADSLATGYFFSFGRTITMMSKGTKVTEGSQHKGKQGVNMNKCLPPIFSPRIWILCISKGMEHLLTPSWYCGTKPWEMSPMVFEAYNTSPLRAKHRAWVIESSSSHTSSKLKSEGHCHLSLYRIQNWVMKALSVCMLGCSVVWTLYNPMDCSLPGSSVHGDSPGKNTGVDCHAPFLGIFLTQGSNPYFFCLLHWQVGSLPLVPPGKPIMMTTCFQPNLPLFILVYQLSFQCL